MRCVWQIAKLNKKCCFALAAALCLFVFCACAGENAQQPASSNQSSSLMPSPSSTAAPKAQENEKGSQASTEPPKEDERTGDNPAPPQAPLEQPQSKLEPVEPEITQQFEELNVGEEYGQALSPRPGENASGESSHFSEDSSAALTEAESGTEASGVSAPVSRATILTVRTPKAGGRREQRSQAAVIDYSNTSEGYIMVTYTGSNPKVKLQITGPDKNTYTYTLHKNVSDAFALTGGNGSYTANVLENIQGNSYALALTASFDVKLSNALLPFLYPNQYVNFNANSKTVAKGEELAKNCATEIEVVQTVYNYIISNTSYDNAKVATVTSGYVPDVDEILASKKGICFDYAALMATMLRTQNIPTRMETGYTSNGVFHAWISVYLKETGWVNGLISFDGKSWSMMDPTYASSSASPKSFTPSSSNYLVKYLY